MRKDTVKFMRPTPEQQREIEERAKWAEAFEAVKVKYAEATQIALSFQEGS